MIDKRCNRYVQGKIEEKLTEIKARKEEENSPRKLPPVKDENEPSNVSDSEHDLSESSISKTCGIVSTTEGDAIGCFVSCELIADLLGVEMSSDEDATPSLEKDTSSSKKGVVTVSPSGLRRRFKLFKERHAPKEGTISTESLRDICSVTSGFERSLTSDFVEDIESGVDVLEEGGLQEGRCGSDVLAVEEILNEITEHIENIGVDDEKVLHVREMDGSETKEMFNGEDKEVTVFAPVGFVDMRNYIERKPPNYL